MIQQNQYNFINPISYLIKYDFLNQNQFQKQQKNIKSHDQHINKDNHKQSNNKKIYHNNFQSLLYKSIHKNKQNHNSHNQQCYIYSHTGWIYENKIYVLGGCLMGNHQNMTTGFEYWNGFAKNNQNFISIYTYDLLIKKWYITQFNINKKSFLQNYINNNSNNNNNNNNANTNSTNSSINTDTQPYQQFSLFQYSSISSCQLSSCIYLFSGCPFSSFSGTNQFYKLDLQKHSLQKIQQKGQIPQPRQGGNLIKYDENWLVLYGGWNIENMIVYNDFYAFNLNQQYWHNMTGSFQYLINPRIQTKINMVIISQALLFIKSSLAYNGQNNNKIKQFYMFGGWFMNYEYKKIFLNDFYQFNITNLDQAARKLRDSKKQKGKVHVKPIICPKYPPKRAGHQLIQFQQKYLLLIGGYTSSFSSQLLKQQQFKYLNDIWLFNIIQQQWIQIMPEKIHSFIPRANFFICHKSYKDKDKKEFYIFGGKSSCLFKNQNNNGFIDNNNENNNDFIINNNNFIINNNDLIINNNDFIINNNDSYDMGNLNKITKLTILDCELYQTQLKHIKKVKQKQKCQTCSQPQQIYSQVQFSCQQLDNLIFSGIPFPFCAIGTLINTLITQKQTKQLFIEYHVQQSSQQNNLTIENDTQFPFQSSQCQSYTNILTIFNNYQLNTNDKKNKIQSCKKKQILMHFNNLKIAGLRLGQDILWLAYADTEIIVYCIRKQSLNAVKSYQAYFYAIDSTTHQIISGYDLQVKLYVQKYYSTFIQKFLKSKKTNQIIRISKLRKKQSINNNNEYSYSSKNKQYYQLKPDLKKNTIRINEQFQKKRNFLYPSQIRNQQSIDINLRPFISMLYIYTQTRFYLKVSYPYSKLTSKSTSSSNNNDNKFQQILSHYNLHKIDNLVKNDKLLQIDHDILEDFQCKFVQMYYDPNKYDNINKNQKDKQIFKQMIYPNGLLFYHKNKLVCRYKYPLGSVLTFQSQNWTNQNYIISDNSNKNYKNQLQNNNFKRKSSQIKLNRLNKLKNQTLIKSRMQHQMRIYGIISIPDRIPINMFQTQFLYPQILQKLQQKIVQVQSLYEKAYFLDTFNEQSDQKQQKQQEQLDKKNKKQKIQQNIYIKLTKDTQKQPLINQYQKQSSIIDVDEHLTPEQEIKKIEENK